MNLLLNWKTYLKFLSRNKGYTAIDLFGLIQLRLHTIELPVDPLTQLTSDRNRLETGRLQLLISRIATSIHPHGEPCYRPHH